MLNTFQLKFFLLGDYTIEQSNVFSSKLTNKKERDQHHAQRKEKKNKASYLRGEKEKKY